MRACHEPKFLRIAPSIVPRPRRHHVTGAYYHVTLRGNHRAPIFFAESDYLMLEELVGLVTEDHGLRVHAYCWMPNHLHLAIQVGQTPLGVPMARLASVFARRVQRRVPTTGHLFERRYHAVLVDTERYLFALIRYIHLNPVRAGIVAAPADYRWSSHHAYLGGQVAPWLTVDTVLGLLSPDRSRALAAFCLFMHEQPTKEELAILRHGVAKVASPPTTVTRPAPAPLRAASQDPLTFDLIVMDVCAGLGIARDLLLGPRKRRDLVHARALIAAQALRRNVCTLSEAARRLGRSPATLSESINALRRDDPELLKCRDPQIRRLPSNRKPGT